MYSLSRTEEADLCREGGKFASSAHAHFLEDVTYVVPRGSCGDHECLRDLLVRHAAGDEPQHFPLALGERSQPWILGLLCELDEAGSDGTCHHRVEQRLAGGHSADGP